MQESQILGAEQLEDVRARYLKLYTGAIADILDRMGYRNQVLPYYVTPVTVVDRVAGAAFTGQGYPATTTESDDTHMRLAMLDSITPGTVSVWATGGSFECAHWGEIMSTAARERGCTGAVVDGGVRDVDFINIMKYPVFARFKCPASSISRWEIKEFQVPIEIGKTAIRPGDFVFGDTDGVVIVPRETVVDVLVAAEDVYERERSMREALSAGMPIKQAHAKFGAF